MRSLLFWEHYAGNFLASKEPPHRPILLDFGLTKKLSIPIKQALAKMFLASAEVCKYIFVVFLSLLKLILCWIFNPSKEIYLMSNILTSILWAFISQRSQRRNGIIVFHFACSLQGNKFTLLLFSSTPVILMCGTRLPWWVLKIKLN